MELKRFGCAVALLFGVVSSVAFAQTAAPANNATHNRLISAEDFADLPFLSGPRLSPNGKRVLSPTVSKGIQRLIAVEIGTTRTQITHSFVIPDEYDLVWYRWANDERILISVGTSQRFYGEDLYTTRLLLHDFATGETKFVGKKNEGADGDDVIHVAEDGKSLLLSIQKTIYDYPSVWRVNLDTLEMKQVVGAYTDVWDWFADSNGVVRAGLGVSGRRWWLLYRKDEKGRFEKVLKRQESESENDIERFIPINGTDQGYAVANSKTGRYGLYHYDFATDSIGDAVFEHPEVDLDDFSQTRTGEISAIHYIDDRRRIQWLEPRMKQIQEDIDKALPNRVNRVVSSSRDGKIMLVWTGSASDPGAYYHYNVDAALMSLLARPYSKIRSELLAPMESTSYTARDGLKIPAFLTQPRDREAKALPLIVMPHGGPFVRDEWTYDTWVQFLANRGYVVLQPNFRGSTGYGREFVARGEGQWGRAMQDDLDDGVKWLVDQGKVDPKRVCIMGASYGGYAAMWAAARNPDIYRCAISFAGISDLEAMMRYDRRQFSATRYYRNWRAKVQGDKTFDLDSVSPLYAIDKVAIPLFIAHGSADKNVPISQSRKFHEALKKKNKAHTFVEYEGEGHGFDEPTNAVDFLNRVEGFLQANNPAN